MRLTNGTYYRNYLRKQDINKLRELAEKKAHILHAIHQIESHKSIADVKRECKIAIEVYREKKGL